MSLAPTIGEAVWDVEKYYLCEEKFLFKPNLQKNLCLKVKIASCLWHVWQIHWYWYICYIKVSLLVERVRLDGLWLQVRWAYAIWTCALLSALLSHHENNLLPCETLIVISYESCDDPSITSKKTACLCWLNYVYTIPARSPTMCPEHFMRVN